MKEIKPNHLLEYLSPTLILSYFFIHNIILVLLGILFSLYLINFNFINSLIRSINKNLFIIKETRKLNNNDKENKSDPINMKLCKEDSELTLVETIEELGFIPSLDKNNESNAA